MNLQATLPRGLSVLERGWLSSNNILIQGEAGTALIDSSYHTHAPQTLALVQNVLKDQPLDLLINTHLHSDHCGGNAALQAAYPQVRTLIPPGQAGDVRNWNPYALSYTPTGQHCPRFGFDGVLQPGADLRLGDALWQIHAAPGHDSHSVVLFEPQSRCLISADALWQRGFGVVFPELDGEGAFDEVAATLDVIEALHPSVVIPGHGTPFTDVAQALTVARQRLVSFVASPRKHIQYAAKVMLKFKLLEAQRITRADLLAWAQGTPYLAHLFAQQFGGAPFAQGLDALVSQLVRSGAATTQATVVFNA
ncbi:MBL fold metallo-hydrolase [Rhodoferax antarcticus]|uniref:MBL fold metallo-hydrolase n=1 Tax=Rhodoferax antarcticus TaxID=81479 RepID=UPI00094FC69C|nr:MBL fold metallo-hydrolase [Rhodoferax antarcticus]APW45680.1 MBL fold metallo-hydrolase [Rhodoferax antarcticus]